MGTAMARGKRTIVVVLILISVPMAIAVVEALSYYRDNRNNGSIISSGTATGSIPAWQTPV